MGRLFQARVRRQRDGDFLAACDAPVCLSRASSEEEALRKLREEIRYRLEYCPCSGVDDDYVQLEVKRS